LVEDDVLATRLLIGIVNQDNFHGFGQSGRVDKLSVVLNFDEGYS
jgi:hypothetical protein